MKNQTIGVFFGSRSTEHDVSIVTAIGSIIKPLELSRQYTEIIPIYIAKDGRWYSDPALKDIGLFSSGKIDEWCDHHQPMQLLFDNGLKLVKSGLRPKVINIDVAFPATHGTHGEDGDLMGIFEMANVPYVGCGVAASAVAMDKVLAKQVAEANGLPIAKYVSFSKHDYETNPDAFLKQIKTLKHPLFVKPSHLGSSIGISRINNSRDLINAIEVALHYDSSAIVEEAVTNLIEVTLPIMGNETPRPALLEKPLTKPEDFFDFDTKYMSGGKKGKAGGGKKSGAQGYSQLPADLPKGIYRQAINVGLGIYKALGCNGIARVDMLIDSQKEIVYFNEINPLPGSLYAHNWAKAGVSGIELVTTLVDLALSQAETKKQSETVFSTNYLKQY
ncbi:MAG: D-alanine--D-alanine ligase family protein [Candidatus Saccharimonadales bacterium]